ncbi:hypothetical protein [Bowmanella pacifica]|uniref:Uncharacterized protein n=1 Tax=Bowmanella pacifica TaxID=502051 RepID=A0A917YUK9_9ALTE|nr:hypothetical protein [Bowmanella pacifica]GGO65960.1 hypothetical protein GCM10010982_09040 [Bowmanella pacifica]
MKITKLIIALPLCLTVMSGQAQTLASAIQSCAQEKDSLKRLVCYDKVAKETNQYKDGDTAFAPASTTPQVNRKATAPALVKAEQHAAPVVDAEQNFGLDERKRPENETDKILVSIQNKDKDPHGKWVLTMTNGQIWKQSDSGSYRLPDAQLYIERGVLGSFFLGAEGMNRKIRVKRIK